MIVYIYNIGVDLYNGFNGLRHRINWTYFAVLDGLAHPLYSAELNCFDFNMSKPGSDEQLFALRKLLRNKLPKGLTVLAPVYFDYGKYTYFSEDVFINHGCYFMDGGSITIGKNTFVGPFCGFYTSNHPLNYADRNKGLEQAL